MICLDKADKGALRHLAYNQSPPALAASQTTRQDLNGISNLRQYVAAAQPRLHAGGGGFLGPAAAADTVACPRRRPGSSATVPLRPWLACLLSLLLFAALLSPFFSSSATGPLVSLEEAEQQPDLDLDLLSRPPPPSLHKRSSCGDPNSSNDEYNTPLHAGALVIIWFVSTLGCSFPIIVARLPGLRIPVPFFFAVRHFGTGVLIATAFVHLLPTAFVSLGNPCLGDFWTKKYNAMPGAIALAAIFLVIIVEMVFHPSRHAELTPPRPAFVASPASPQANRETESTRTPMDSPHALLSTHDKGLLHGRSSSISHGLSQLDQNSAPPEIDSSDPDATDLETRSKPDLARQNDSPAQHQHDLLSEQRRRKERLQCVLLEMGILFHSIFIGLALSVSTGTEFIVLLIAIIFHQTFEGLALGSRISAADWPENSWQPWLMAVAYGCTTPIGQAIGLATHTLYSPNSEVGLIVVGVMNAISAGLLVFASLVELLSEDFLSDESWRCLRGKRRVLACLLVFLGAFLMSLVGAWA